MAPLQTAEFSGPVSVSNSLNHGTIKGYDEVREATTLEKCVDIQRGNMDAINDISRRITSIYGRLTNKALKGSGGECGESASEGILGDHKTALEMECTALGEILADLSELESLL